MSETEPKKKVLADFEEGLVFKFKVGDCVCVKHLEPRVKFVVRKRFAGHGQPHYDVQTFDPATHEVRYYDDFNEDILELCQKQEDQQS